MHFSLKILWRGILNISKKIKISGKLLRKKKAQIPINLIHRSVHWGTINFLISLTSDFFCYLGGKKTETQKKERKPGSRDFSYLILVYGMNCKPGADEKKPTKYKKQPSHSPICWVANVALMKLNLLLPACTSGLQVGLFFPPFFYSKMLMHTEISHHPLPALMSARQPWGGRIWRICWLQAGVFSTHTPMLRAARYTRSVHVAVWSFF